MNPKWRTCEGIDKAESEGIHDDRLENRHFQPDSEKSIAAERRNSGCWYIPVSLYPLTCVDLTRELEGWKPLGYSLSRFGFDFTASVAFEQALRAKLGAGMGSPFAYASLLLFELKP